MSTTFTAEGHTDRILQKMWKRCGREELCDVVLIAGTEEQRFPAHRSVLSEASEYFKGMFTSSLRESTSKVVKNQEVGANALQSLLEYCYIGSVVINEDIAVELLKTAHMLLFGDVVTACSNFLIKGIDLSNCLEFALLAKRYNCTLLLQKAKDYCLLNIMDISRTAEFLQLNAEQLRLLLASGDLYLAPAEEDIFNSVMTWLQYDAIEREQYKIELLNLAKPRILAQILMGITLDVFMFKSYINYYCPQRQKWMKCLKELDYCRNFSTNFMNNCLYFIGGNGDEEFILSEASCLTLNTMTLTDIAPMNESRANFCVAALNGVLYAVGGENDYAILNSAEKTAGGTRGVADDIGS